MARQYSGSDVCAKIVPHPPGYDVVYRLRESQKMIGYLRIQTQGGSVASYVAHFYRARKSKKPEMVSERVISYRVGRMTVVEAWNKLKERERNFV